MHCYVFQTVAENCVIRLRACRANLPMLIERMLWLSWGDKEELTLNAFALQLSRLHQRLIKKFTSTAFRL